MGWYYRKKKGAATFSLSRRGPRVSIGFGGGKGGCLLPAVLIAGCLLALGALL